LLLGVSFTTVVFKDIEITQGLDNFKTPILLALGRYDYLTGPPEL
jgi:proline iminopeptidase